jgi:hypothetical protein
MRGANVAGVILGSGELRFDLGLWTPTGRFAGLRSPLPRSPMNNAWMSLILLLVTSGIGYFASQVLRGKWFPQVHRQLKPIIEDLFPALRTDPWLFEPIAEADLPAWQRKHFEQHTPGYLARGFTVIDDFVLRRDCEPSCVRLLLSRDRTVIGGLNCYLGGKTIEGMSVLLDGTYLETANIDCDTPPPKEHGLQFFVCKTNDAMALIDFHQASIARTAAAAGSSPVVLEPSDVQAVVNYGRQLSLRSLHKQGVLGELPEFLKERHTITAH